MRDLKIVEGDLLDQSNEDSFNIEESPSPLDQLLKTYKARRKKEAEARLNK